MDNRIKYVVAAFLAAAFMVAAYFLPAETFLAFVVGWLFLIPAAFTVYLVYGFMEYLKERRHRITVSVKPSEAMKAITRREAELKREKEKILYEEFHNEKKR